MYLHIGNEYSVKIDDIIGVFDIENTTINKKYTNELLDNANKAGRCIYTTYELPKSFIVAMKNNKEIVYISQLAVSTLRKRLSELNYK